MSLKLQNSMHKHLLDANIWAYLGFGSERVVANQPFEPAFTLSLAQVMFSHSIGPTALADYHKSKTMQPVIPNI